MTQENFTTWKHKGGWCGAAWTDKGIAATDFRKKSEASVISTLRRNANVRKVGLDEAPAFVKKFQGQLADYFNGKKVDFRVPLDLSAGTFFQREVWRACGDITLGSAKTYGGLASAIGRPRAARAVGAALGANPVPILIPCHRVLASNGALGGFSRGLDEKKWLLALEGIPSAG